MFTNNKIWDKLFSDKLTVVNDPTLKWGNSSALIDWEGVTLEKRIIIENWIWKEKFADYKNVKKDSTLKLWNSTVTNILVKWEKTPDFLRDSDFLFTNLMAYHTVDSNTWKFALNGEWYVIKDWKKAEYVKNISLAGNIKDIFTNIVAIWDDDYENGWNACPSITFKGWTIIV
jgi:PmbA protein